MLQRGMSRRDALRTLGISAGALGVGAVVVACGSSGDAATQAAGGNAGNQSTATTATSASASSSSATAATGSSSSPASSSAAATSSSTTAAADRKVLTVGVQGLPDALDPYMQLSNVGTRVTYALFDQLLERDFRDGDPPGTGSTIKPMVASKWNRIDDLTLELTLRDDVTFHNGDPLTAQDIKFTFDRMLVNTPAALKEARGYVSTIKSVDVIDDHTVRFVTSYPDPLLEIRLTSWATWIMPQKAYEAAPDKFALSPIGTGPYKFVEMEPDDKLVLDSHDPYWQGLPPVKQVLFRVIPETAARITALVSGEVDLITNIPPDQVPSLKQNKDITVRSVPLANCHVLEYNTKHPVLANKQLRQAMNLAIDRKLLIDTLWNGVALQMRSHQFPEYGDMYNANRPYTPFDANKARQLVKDSGYKGDNITFITQSDYYTNGLAAGQAIIQMWQDVGLKAEIQVLEDTNSVPKDQRMVWNWSNSSFVADPDGAFWLRWGNETPAQKDWWTPADPKFNELGQQARQTLDKQFRYNAYQTMLDIWEDEAPGTVLYIPVENYSMRKNVDWLPYSFYYMDLRSDNLKIT